MRERAVCPQPHQRHCEICTYMHEHDSESTSRFGGFSIFSFPINTDSCDGNDPRFSPVSWLNTLKSLLFFGDLVVKHEMVDFGHLHQRERFQWVHRTLPIQVNIVCQQKNIEKHFTQMCNRKNDPTGPRRRKMESTNFSHIMVTVQKEKSEKD